MPGYALTLRVTSRPTYEGFAFLLVLLALGMGGTVFRSAWFVPLLVICPVMTFILVRRRPAVKQIELTPVGVRLVEPDGPFVPWDRITLVHSATPVAARFPIRLSHPNGAFDFSTHCSEPSRDILGTALHFLPRNGRLPDGPFLRGIYDDAVRAFGVDSVHYFSGREHRSLTPFERDSMFIAFVTCVAWLACCLVMLAVFPRDGAATFAIITAAVLAVVIVGRPVEQYVNHLVSRASDSGLVIFPAGIAVRYGSRQLRAGWEEIRDIRVPEFAPFPGTFKQNVNQLRHIELRLQSHFSRSIPIHDIFDRPADAYTQIILDYWRAARGIPLPEVRRGFEVIPVAGGPTASPNGSDVAGRG